MKRTAIIVLALLSWPVLAQQHPNRDRGFAPNRVYDFSSIDNVNVFNGNLVVTIPIGSSYPVSNSLAYRLTLVHSGNPWSMLRQLSGTGQGNPQEEQYPNPRSNAGLGWQLSLGQMITPADVFNATTGPTPGWVYLSADGNEQQFGSAAQFVKPHVGMRRTTLPGKQQLELADGTIQIYDAATGRLEEIRDRFGAVVQVDYSQPNVWRITDSTSREHRIVFKADPTNAYARIVDYVDLAAFDGTSARYQFSYVYPTISRGCIHSTFYGVGYTVGVPLLESITLPDNTVPSSRSKYSMTYEHGNAADAACATVQRWSSGSLRTLVLPTGGRYEWTWQQYLFPQASSNSATMRAAPGVHERRLRDMAKPGCNPSQPETCDSTWIYDTDLGDEGFCIQPRPEDPPECFETELINTLTAPDGSKTRRYFSAYAGSSGPAGPEGWSGEEYGLNFTRYETDGSALSRFVASEVLASNGIPVRKEYQLYEGLSEGRLKASRTVFLDDCNGAVCRYADVENHGYDGYGHYRQSSTGGNFAGSNFKTTFTNYQGPGPAGEWVLTTYSEQCAAVDAAQRTAAISSCSQLPNASIAQFSFDRATGFLNQRRTLAGSTPASTDLLAVFQRTPTGGTTETVTESYSGGDVCPIGAPGCGTAQYKLFHDYAGGVLTTSRYEGFNFFLALATPDANTGLPERTFDSAGGAEIEYGYDALGRLLSATPLTEPRTGRTAYSYSSGIVPATVAEKKYALSGVQLLQRQWVFDDFGRVKEEIVERPGGTSKRISTYDAFGRATAVSELEDSAVAGQHLTTMTYDLFGRVLTVQAPDFKIVQTRYTGSRLVERLVPRATSATGPDTITRTCEEYDRFGRLHQVHEGVGRTTNGLACAAGAVSITTYTYDEGDRLNRVDMSADGVTQVRQFEYDNRGLLTQEQHPERNGPTFHSGFDARGHAARRRDGAANGPFDVSFQYDRAERLTAVRETSTQRLLKELVYADENECSGVCDWRKGRLWKAIRHNWLNAADKVTVTDTFTYAGRDNRVSQKVTKVVDGAHSPELTQSFQYDDLGNTNAVTYPGCGSCGAGSARTVTNDYVTGKGFLTAVSGFTSAAPNGITYWPNGLMKTVAHSNGVSEKQFIDESTAMARPLRFEFTGWIEPVQCAAPALSGPAGTTIDYGQTATLSVAASNGGNGVLSFAWYRGTAPDQSTPVGNNPASYTTPALFATTSYWVRVTNTCGSASASANSVTAVVVVNPQPTCPAPTVSGPAGATIGYGQTAPLSVTASNGGNGTLFYAWYRGNAPDQSTPVGNGAASYTTPALTDTTSYWVKVTNTCTSGSASVNSSTATVSVRLATPANVVATPQPDQTIRVTWTAVPGATSYTVRRKQGAGSFTSHGAASSPYNDGATSEYTGYVYRVVANRSGALSSEESGGDVAVRAPYTQMIAPLAVVRGADLSELRRAVDAARIVGGLPAAWGSYAPPTGLIYAAQFAEVHARLSEARTQLNALYGVSLMNLGSPPVTGQLIHHQTAVLLRAGVQ